MDQDEYQDLVALLLGWLMRFNHFDIGRLLTPTRKVICKYLVLNFLSEQKPILLAPRFRRGGFDARLMYINWERNRTFIMSSGPSAGSDGGPSSSSRSSLPSSSSRPSRSSRQSGPSARFDGGSSSSSRPSRSSRSSRPSGPSARSGGSSSNLSSSSSSSSSSNPRSLASSFLANLSFLGLFEPLNQGEFKDKGLEKEVCDELRAYVLAQPVDRGRTLIWLRLTSLANIYFMSRSEGNQYDSMTRAAAHSLETQGCFRMERRFLDGLLSRHRQKVQCNEVNGAILMERIRRDARSRRRDTTLTSRSQCVYLYVTHFEIITCV